MMQVGGWQFQTTQIQDDILPEVVQLQVDVQRAREPGPEEPFLQHLHIPSANGKE